MHYFENKGNGVYVAHPDDSLLEYMDDYVLKGFVDNVIEILKKDAKHIVLDFQKIRRFRSHDATEIIGAHRYLEKAGAKLYFCNLGPEDQHPHKMVKIVGIPKLDTVEIRESLDETVAELSQQH